MANIYALTGRQKEAIAEWRRRQKFWYKQMSEAVGTAYRLHGYQNALRVLAVQLEAESQHAHIPNWVIAQIYGHLGDKDRAFIYLERGYKSKGGIWSLSEPRFAAMMQRVGLQQ